MLLDKNQPNVKPTGTLAPYHSQGLQVKSKCPSSRKLAQEVSFIPIHAHHHSCIDSERERERERVPYVHEISRAACGGHISSDPCLLFNTMVFKGVTSITLFKSITIFCGIFFTE